MISFRTSIAVAFLTAQLATVTHGQVLSTQPEQAIAVPAPQAQAKVPPSKVASRPAKPVQIRAEDGAVTATLTAASDMTEVGKAMLFTLTIESRDGASFSIPKIESTLGPFEIQDVRRTTSRDGESQRSVISFAAMTYESGAIELPAIEVEWKDPQEKAGTFSVGPTAIEVISLIGADFDPNIYRDIKGEVDIDVGGSWWWMVAAAAVIVLGLLLWALRMRQSSVAEKALTPNEWARKELDRLEQDGLVQQGDLHGFWVRLSGTVREYVERRFDIAAPDQTTKEFLAQASKHPMIGAEHRHLLTDFLRAADMVKFAAHRPAEQDCSHGLDAARGFVQETAPVANATREEMAVKS